MTALASRPGDSRWCDTANQLCGRRLGVGDADLYGQKRQVVVVYTKMRGGRVSCSLREATYCREVFVIRGATLAELVIDHEASRSTLLQCSGLRPNKAWAAPQRVLRHCVVLSTFPHGTSLDEQQPTVPS